MFGWLFPARCPVTSDRQAWLERGLSWLGQELDAPRLLARPIVLPVPEFFPEPYDGTPEAAEKIFARVCQYMEVSRDRVVLGWYINERDALPRHFREGRSAGAAGLYWSGPGPIGIELDETLLTDPTALVATMAHELGHVHLLADGRLSPDIPDHEPLTDLLTVLYGLGVFTANAVIRESQWSDGNVSGWSVGRQGYLTGPEYGYALALVARGRGEASPGWAVHLRPDVRSAVKAGLRFLDATGAPPFPTAPLRPMENDVPWTRPRPADDNADDDRDLPPWMRNKGR